MGNAGHFEWVTYTGGAMKQTCPRAIEDGRGPDSPFVQFEFLSKPDDGTCDYCGSIDGDTFMARVENGDVRLTPTDKNYKVYVENDGGEPFRRSYRTDSVEKRRVAAAKNMRALRDGKTAEELGLTAGQLKDVEFYENGFDPDPADQRNWEWTTEERQEAKFYFQHLSEDQRRRFVDLVNAKTLKLGYPGHFYRLPFFVSREPVPA